MGMGGVRMSYGITTVECIDCKKIKKMYGWLPIALQIWNQDEGLLCCDQQTQIINQEEKEE